jgi:hypothetical protein
MWTTLISRDGGYNVTSSSRSYAFKLPICRPNLLRRSPEHDMTMVTVFTMQRQRSRYHESLMSLNDNQLMEPWVRIDMTCKEPLSDYQLDKKYRSIDGGLILFWISDS